MIREILKMGEPKLLQVARPVMRFNTPELRNLVEVASLIVDSAYSRHESRGLHFSRDYPETLPKALPTVMQPVFKRERGK